MTYLFDMSWKLAISFLSPFFVALLLADGDTAIILSGMAIGLALSTVVIFYQVKRINKEIDNV